VILPQKHLLYQSTVHPVKKTLISGELKSCAPLLPATQAIRLELGFCQVCAIFLCAISKEIDSF